MLRTIAYASRGFATAPGKDKPFLSDAIAKAAIGKDPEVAASFVSAFAPVVHHQHVRVTGVTSLPGTTGLTLVRDMKHDITLRYSVGGTTSAVLDVVPQHYSRALVEIQQKNETYLPGRALAHAGGHFLAAVHEEANLVKEEAKKAKEEKDAKRTAEDAAASQEAPKRRKSPSKGPKSVFDTAVYTAYGRVEPIHQLMLCDFYYAYDTKNKVWRAPTSASALVGGKYTYGWVAPLFSTYRLTTNAGSVWLDAGSEDPGPNIFASSLRDRLSITVVHLPLVPTSLDDDTAWSKVATLPEHRDVLKTTELREWLHYLAHTELKGGKVQMPAELQTHRIFRKSAEMAEGLLGSSDFSYSEKEMADFALQAEREKEEALEQERAAAAAALEQERAAAAAVLKQEKAAAAAAAEREQAAAAALKQALAEVERLKRGEK